MEKPQKDHISTPREILIIRAIAMLTEMLEGGNQFDDLAPIAILLGTVKGRGGVQFLTNKDEEKISEKFLFKIVEQMATTDPIEVRDITVKMPL